MNRSLWRKAVALTLTAAMTAGLTACGGGGNSTSADGKKRYFKADYLSDLPDSFNDTRLYLSISFSFLLSIYKKGTSNNVHFC